MYQGNNPKYNELIEELCHLKNSGQYRSLRDIETKNSKYITINGKNYLNLSSNDYLGLATDESLFESFAASLNQDRDITKFGFSSSSSRLLTGSSIYYNELETELSKLYERESAIIFNSGYHANTGIVSALAQKGDVIFCDKQNHASIVDGMMLSKAEFYRYNHLNYEQLESLLEKHRENYKKSIIISESVFSMDGDRANLRKLVELKNKYNSILIIDEAHAVGVFGQKGCGICEEEGLIQDIDIIVGTFGKALASVGAYAIADPAIKEYLINKMRPLIFSTALPPINIFWSLNIIKALPEYHSKRIHLSNISNLLRNSIKDHGLDTRGESQIIPIVIGDNDKTIKAAEIFQDSGILLLPIRPPTVSPGTSRLRISLTASINWEEIKDIPRTITGERN